MGKIGILRKNIAIIFGILIFSSGSLIGWGINEIIDNRLIEVPLPSEVEIVSGYNMSLFLWENFPEVKSISGNDRNYSLPSLSFLEDFLEEDDLDKYGYIEEYFDCDDFGWALKGRAAEKGIPLAVVATCASQKPAGDNGLEKGAHMLNLFITMEEGELKAYVVEPQTDEIWSLDDEFRQGVSFVLI